MYIIGENIQILAARIKAAIADYQHKKPSDQSAAEA